MESESTLLPGVVLIIKIVAFVFASWFLIHIIAVAGPFMAISLPIWWSFFPSYVPCILCRVKKPGEYCFFCGRESHSDMPVRLRSVFFNMFFILLISAVSLGAVYLEIRILRYFGYPATPKTVTFVIPPKGQYRLGEVFPMEISLKGIERPINALQVDFSVDPRRLEIVEISTKNSFANIFIQKEIDNEQGYGRLTGGLPNPGFFSDRGLFGTVYFRGKMPGLAQIKFLPSSMILANDGEGTNVLKNLSTASYLILPEEVSDTERELQETTLFTDILGASEDNQEQMLFFEEKKQILGEQIAERQQSKFRFHLGETLFGILERIDRAIISLWCKVCFPMVDLNIFVKD